MKTYYKFKTVENFYYDLLECNIFPLSHTTRYAERGCNCRQETDGDLKNGLPSVCFYFTHFDSILKVKLTLLIGLGCPASFTLAGERLLQFVVTIAVLSSVALIVAAWVGTGALAGAAALLGVTSCRSAAAWVRATTI